MANRRANLRYDNTVNAIHLSSGGVFRRSLFFRPPNRPGSLPLVVMLHGTGGSAQFSADETEWASFAAGQGFAVAFPDGLPIDPNSPPRFLTNPQRWNDGSTKPGDPLHTDTEDVRFLADLIRHLIEQWGVDPSRVYLAGFSNGAGMAFRFAAERGDLLAAVAPVAGYCHVRGDRVVSHPVPTLYVVGDADLLIPLHGGTARVPWGNQVVPRVAVADTLAKWARIIGCEPTAREVANDGDVTEAFYPGPVEFRSVTVRGLGHHWPGGKGQFNPRIGGPFSDRLNANERLWTFFQSHRRG